MDSNFLAVVGLILVALTFDYINGFHDAANSIATVVSTRVLSPGKAVDLGGGFQLHRRLHVRHRGRQDRRRGTRRHPHRDVRGDFRRSDRRDRVGPDHVVLRAADELVARADRRLCRRGSGKGRMGAIIVSGWTKTLIFIVLAPLIGLRARFLDHAADDVDRSTDHRRGASIGWFRRLQLLSAAAYSLGHGGNDAQKTMGIIAGALVAGGYLQLVNGEMPIPLWVILAAHAAIALGTLSGGWRIIHTMGSKITKLTAGRRIRRRNRRRDLAVHRHALRHSGQHHAHDHRRDHRRRIDQAAVRGAMGHRRADRLGVDPDHSRLGGDRGRGVLVVAALVAP